MAGPGYQAPILYEALNENTRLRSGADVLVRIKRPQPADGKMDGRIRKRTNKLTL